MLERFKSRYLLIIVGILLTLTLSKCGGGGPSQPVLSDASKPATYTPSSSNTMVARAEAGRLQNLPIGSFVSLDGSASTTASGTISNFDWYITARPAGSTAQLLSSNTSTPNFVADVAGTFAVQLTVSDGINRSKRDIVLVNAGIAAGANTPAAVFNHTGIATGCAACHNGVNAPGKSVSHIPTSNLCEACHSTTTFNQVFTVDHNEVVGVCTDCHLRDKPADHINTNAECDACHTAAGWRASAINPAFTSTVLPAKDDLVSTLDDFSHAGITGGCSACHNKPSDHIPSPDTCELCHTPGDWEDITAGGGTGGVAFNHATNTTGCNACHNKPAGHIASPDICEACHINSNWTVISAFSHTGIVAGCSDCHSQPAAHIAAPNTCELCHVPGNWLAITTGGGAGGIFDHTGIIDGCSACHTQSAGHITAPNTCEICHVPGDWLAITTGGGTGALFDHIGIVDGCSTCHQFPAGHIAAPNTCETCHAPAGWLPTLVGIPAAGGTGLAAGSPITHPTIPAGVACLTCHLSSKTASHPLTTDGCGSCHTTATAGFLPASGVDHLQVAFKGCTSCHDGVFATGKKTGHITTSSQCDTCHVVWSWMIPAPAQPSVIIPVALSNPTPLGSGTGTGGTTNPITAPVINPAPATGSNGTTPGANVSFDHTGLSTTNCVSCHNGSTATAKSTTHIVTSNACEACHNWDVWTPVTFVDHNQLVGTCSSCHNGVIATGKSINHIATTAQCSSCHTRSAW